MKPAVVGMQIDGKVEVHLPGAVSDYATLCGLDDQEKERQRVILPRNAYVNCDQCRAIWETARQYKRTDFKG